MTRQSVPPRHIVAVGSLVARADGKVLLIRSPRRGWEFPGGQVELGESLTDALIREIHEETGITASVGALVGVYSNTRSHIVMFGFLCDYVSGEPTASSESLEVEWVDRGEAVARVVRPPLLDRLRDMLEFDGAVAYRSYAYNTGADGEPEYEITEERRVGRIG